MPARRTTTCPLGPAYAVCGAEAFLRRQAVARLIDRILGDADRSLALSASDCRENPVTLADVLDNLRTLPFLTEQRLVVLHEADDFVSQYRGDLEKYLAAPSPTGVLLLDCRSLPANTRLYRKIAELGEVIECRPLKAGAVPAWLIDHCRRNHGKRLEAQAAALLCDQIGTDLGLLDAELLKLALYATDRPAIAAADVEALTGRHREEQVWNILDAIGAGNRARALELWEEVWLTDKAASARAIGGLAYTVRRLLNARRAQQAGADLEQLRKIMMIWRDDNRLSRKLDAFTIEQLERMLTRLLEADVAGKTGAASVRSSIEAFIIEGCTIRGDQRATG